MIHIKRNICLVAVSCTLLAGIPLQGVAQTGRTAKVQATQNHKITVSGTVLDKTTNDPLIGVSEAPACHYIPWELPHST